MENEGAFLYHKLIYFYIEVQFSTSRVVNTSKNMFLQFILWNIVSKVQNALLNFCQQEEFLLLLFFLTAWDFLRAFQETKMKKHCVGFWTEKF